MVWSRTMLPSLFVLFCVALITVGGYFNGGTINWAPVYSRQNSTPVPITITQTYSWTLASIRCANDVPVSTSEWNDVNQNLICVADCTTDGGYSTRPINSLTDCTSSSTSLNMMSSTRSNNITLHAGAHFYLAYLESAGVPFGQPPQSDVEWLIVTFIDLRMRSDGFINSSPVAGIVSPQYTSVNQTIQIKILVSDINVSDDIRCRWSIHTDPDRRGKRSEPDKYIAHRSLAQLLETRDIAAESLHIRKKRSCSQCVGECPQGYAVVAVIIATKPSAANRMEDAKDPPAVRSQQLLKLLQEPRTIQVAHEQVPLL